MKHIKLFLILTIALLLNNIILSLSAGSLSSKFIKPQVDDRIIDRVSKKIDTLGFSSPKTLNTRSYNSILGDINYYSGPDINRIDAFSKRTLLIKLETTYHTVFVAHAYHVFNNHDWKVNDLQNIRIEADKIWKFTSIENKEKLNEIRKILALYSEISTFISNAKTFANSTTTQRCTQLFDTAATSHKINQAAEYKENMGLVKNCTRLVSELDSIPPRMYRKHLSALWQKVNAYKETYVDTMLNKNGYSVYWDSIYIPLSTDVQILQYGNKYKIPTIEKDVSPLRSIIDAALDKAKVYFNTTN